MMDNYPTPAERLKEVTDKLEAGVTEVFEGGRFADYLQTMSRFHHYSFGNILLIAMQFPGASQVAGFNDWKKKFGRNVKKGEKGIKILAPCIFEAVEEREKLDPASQRPIVDSSGKPMVERRRVEAKRFKVVTVFDVSQTEGKELPEITPVLTGDVEQYEQIIGTLAKLSPVPIVFEDFPEQGHGYFSHTEGRIVVRPGMSQAQTLKTMIHEIAHAKLRSDPGETVPSMFEGERNRPAREVEAESVAYVVCQHLGVDTSGYSFGYVAGWSTGKGTPELKAALDTIRSTAAELIDGLEGKSREQSPPKRTQPASRRSPRKPKGKAAPAR